MTSQPPVIGMAVEVHTHSGVTVYVTPLTQQAMQSLVVAASALHPLPDPKPYETVIEGAFVEGDTRPARENPAYVALVNEIEMERQLFLRMALLSAAVDSPMREQIVAYYRPRTTRMMAYVSGKTDDDLWPLVLQWYVLNEAELVSVLQIAQDKAPLTEAEIREGVKFFRPAVRRPTAASGHRPQSAPDIPETE